MTVGDECLVANNQEELLVAMEQKTSTILISKQFKPDFLDKTEIPLSEKEQMGFEIGFAGAGSILSGIFYFFINMFSKGEKIQQVIDRKIQLYHISVSEEDLLLRLRQLDY